MPQCKRFKKMLGIKQEALHTHGEDEPKESVAAGSKGIMTQLLGSATY